MIPILFLSFAHVGLKSYSKVICVFSLVPVFGMFMLCTKMLGLAPIIGFQHHDIFPETDWSEFFLNTKVMKNYRITDYYRKSCRYNLY